MANIAIVHTETHDETKPAGSRARSLGDDDIREKDRALRERLAIDHQSDADESGNTAIGIHKKVTMKVIADPTTYDDVGYVYLKTVSAVIELFYKDSAGNITQLTSGGVIKDSVLAKTGDWMLSSVTTARAGWTNVSATYSNKFMRINATPLSTGGADTHDHGGATGSHTLSAAESGVPAHTHNVLYRDSAGVGYPALAAVGGNQENHVTDANAAAAASTGHTHTVASADNVPAYVQTVVFQKD